MSTTAPTPTGATAPDAPATVSGWPGWASWGEVARWAGVSGVVAAVLLAAVGIVAAHVPGREIVGIDSALLARHHTLADLRYVLERNLLVLGIHLCACWIGAIIGRPHRPAPESWGRLAALHRPVPEWIGRAAVVYALLVTLLSVGVQALGLGRELANLSRAAGVPTTRLLVLVLPHAVPELFAVFLPLGLFLLEARRGRLDRLGPWSLQAALIAVPVLVCAAAIETYVTPPRIIDAGRAAATAHVHPATSPVLGLRGKPRI